MRQSKTLKERIRRRIARMKKTDVFFPRDFSHLGGEDQVLRALRSLVREGALVRLGYGVYVRAILCPLSGRVTISSPKGFHSAALQALDRLGVPWKHSVRTMGYIKGRSTPIPVNPTVRIKARFNRRLSYGRTELCVER